MTPERKNCKQWKPGSITSSREVRQAETHNHGSWLSTRMAHIRGEAKHHLCGCGPFGWCLKQGEPRSASSRSEETDGKEKSAYRQLTSTEATIALGEASQTLPGPETSYYKPKCLGTFVGETAGCPPESSHRLGRQFAPPEAAEHHVPAGLRVKVVDLSAHRTRSKRYI